MNHIVCLLALLALQAAAQEFCVSKCFANTAASCLTATTCNTCASSLYTACIINGGLDEVEYTN